MSEASSVTTRCPVRGRGPGRRSTVALLALVLGAGLVTVSGAGPASATIDGDITLVSHRPASVTTPSGDSSNAIVSADGNFVVFNSEAHDVIAGQSDQNNSEANKLDVFLYERATGNVTLVSHEPATTTTTGNQASFVRGISADGAYVVFASGASDLTSFDINSASDIFLFARASGQVSLVSRTGTSSSANGASDQAVISADGSYVAFTSAATNLVFGQVDANSGRDLFLYARSSGAVSLVSHVPGSAVTTGGVPCPACTGLSEGPSISADGSFVAFRSNAPDLVTGQVDPARPVGGNDDVFLFSRGTGSVTLVSHSAASTTTTGNAVSAGSGAPVLSADGATVAFVSRATNLVSGQLDADRAPLGDGQEDEDVFYFDRTMGSAVNLVSHVPGNFSTTADGHSWFPKSSANGLYMAFDSKATNLMAAQTDAAGTRDAFFYERLTGTSTLASHTPQSATTASGTAVFPDISSDGNHVAFTASGTNLVANQVDTNNGDDVFLFSRTAKPVRLVSHVPGSAIATGEDFSQFPSLSADGGFVTFSSWAINLVPGQNDTNHRLDVFLYERPGQVASFIDFDGDSDTDVSVFRPSSSTWFVQGGATTAFGTNGDIPVPGDYDGDGDTEPAVFRPSNGVWFAEGSPPVAYGTSGDIPVPADWNNDGTTDRTVFRPSTGTWFINLLGYTPLQWGTAGDIPAVGDYNGNTLPEFAVFRPSTGTWFVHFGPAVQFGTNGDVPVPGDWDADGDTDIAVYRPSNGAWFVQGGPVVNFGTSGDIPVPGDYDTDGDADVAVFRPSTGFWFILGGATTPFGTNGDVPLPLPTGARMALFP